MESRTSRSPIDDLQESSTVADLPHWKVSLSPRSLGGEAAAIFDKDKSLPGILVLDGTNYVGLLSRDRFFFRMGRRFGVGVFYNGPVQVILESISGGEYPRLIAPESLLNLQPSSCVPRAS